MQKNYLGGLDIIMNKTNIPACVAPVLVGVGEYTLNKKQ